MRTQALDVLLAVVGPEDIHIVCAHMEGSDLHAQRILGDALNKIVS